MNNPDRRKQILDILEAEGEKESAILRADAKKQQQILEAEGEAEAILKVQKARAESIKLLNEAAPSDAVVKLKSLDAFEAAAQGQATKIIIPSESVLQLPLPQELCKRLFRPESSEARL